MALAMLNETRQACAFLQSTRSDPMDKNQLEETRATGPRHADRPAMSLVLRAPVPLRFSGESDTWK